MTSVLGTWHGHICCGSGSCANVWTLIEPGCPHIYIIRSLFQFSIYLLSCGSLHLFRTLSISFMFSFFGTKIFLILTYIKYILYFYIFSATLKENIGINVSRYIYIYIHTHTHIYTHTHICVCIYTCIHT